jgi:hypothetical protein
MRTGLRRRKPEWQHQPRRWRVHPHEQRKTVAAEKTEPYSTLQKLENKLVLGSKSTDRDQYEQRKMKSKSLRSGETSRGESRGINKI